jgi:monoamine oxidase
MSYSYIPVGGAGLRAKLAQPVDEVLYFAGEATNVIRPATVHGALESGVHAARAAMGASTVRS